MEISSVFLILKVIITYILFPLSMYNILKKILNTQERIYIAILSLGLAPSLVSWFFAMTLRIFPHQSDMFYLSTGCGTFFFISCLEIKTLKQSIKEIVQIFDSGALKPAFDRIIYFAILSYVLLIILYYFWMPLLENDPLEYFHLAKIILRKKELGFYPILDGTNTKGFIAPWTHPLGYPTFLAWNMAGLEIGLGQLMAKCGSLYFNITILISLYLISVKEQLTFKHLAGFIFISTPICFYEAYICHVDAARMLLFSVTMITVYLHYLSPSYYSASLIGLASGLSWFYHSSGLLTLLIASGLVGLFSFIKPKKLFLYLILIILSSFIIVIPDLINTFIKTRKIIGDLDNIEVIRLLPNEYKDYLKIGRGINTLKEALLWGVGKVFLQYNTYGASYFFLLMGSFAVLWQYKGTWNIQDKFSSLSLTQHCILVAIIFWLGVILSVFLGLTIFTVNPRYLLQIHPLIVFIGAAGIGTLFQKLNSDEKIIR